MNYTPASKFRHVYCPGLQRICTARKWFVAEEIYQGFRVASTTGDQTYIKGNAKYFAFPAAGGGGPILIRPHNTPGRMPSQLPLLTGHKWIHFFTMIVRGDLCDFDFNPFNDEQIISSSADLTVMVSSSRFLSMYSYGNFLKEGQHTILTNLSLLLQVTEERLLLWSSIQ